MSAAGTDKVRGVVWHIIPGLEQPMGFGVPQMLCGYVIGHSDMGLTKAISGNLVPLRDTDKNTAT